MSKASFKVKSTRKQSLRSRKAKTDASKSCNALFQKEPKVRTKIAKIIEFQFWQTALMLTVNCTVGENDHKKSHC